ncbi:MAG: type II secretion system protein [Patescibacteria group bacterium]
MITTQRSRGFTLIELLVVIAIIGILSAVVLASLNSARAKGSDAGVKSNLSSVESQAAIFASNNDGLFGVFDDGGGNPAACPLPGDSGTTLFHDITVQNAIASAVKDSAGGSALCLSNDADYAVVVGRPVNAEPATTYWCIDHAPNHCGVNSNALTGVSCGECVSLN